MFFDRKDAGRKLAQALRKYKKQKPVILAIPRGGVIVAKEVAQILHSPLDVIVARKVGSPFNPEFGIASVSEGGILISDRSINRFGISEEHQEVLRKQAEKELKRRVLVYRHGKGLPELRRKTVILIDDGLATGVTAKAAIASIRLHCPSKIIFAVPICASQTAKEIRPLVDEFVCLSSSDNLRSIGEYYASFQQVTDEEVVDLLM